MKGWYWMKTKTCRAFSWNIYKYRNKEQMNNHLYSSLQEAVVETHALPPMINSSQFQLSFCNAALLWTMCMALLHEATLTGVATAFGENETDRLALLAIKAQITYAPLRAMSSWNDSLHFCQWQGVSCSRRHQRVTVLNLHSLGLVGSLSPLIGNLSFLRTINLSNNSFQGEVPPEIGHLFRLQILNLTNNWLEGQFPANLSQCSNLRILDLGNNNFTGKVPFELGSLSKLLQLFIDHNNLTGTIAPTFGNLSSLRVLFADSNELNGSIPDSLGRLQSLATLILSRNQLSGMIPPSISNLTSLTEFRVSFNQLEGSLPLNLWSTLPNLRFFFVHVNRLSGPIPVFLSNASNLEILDLSSNKFSGGVAINFGNLHNLSWLSMFSNSLGSGATNDLSFISSLTNCSRLKILFLNDNNFGGVLPNSLGNLSTQLQWLSFGGNQISGNIPTGVGNLVNLIALDMHRNQFTGSIPTSIGNLHKLQEVGFGKNKLSGAIPSSIGNLTLLNQLWLEENNFQGSIPSTLGNCHNLILLHVYGNNLSGGIPREVMGLSSLAKSLNLARNSLSGLLPWEVGHLRNLVELDISQNQLSGDIPSSLGSCIRLERLYMYDNSFGGDIPQSLNTMRGLEKLDLSHNNLSGEIPRYLATIPLRILNLSSNDFEGEIPEDGVFRNASAISIAGNSRLCGGIPELQLPRCSKDQKRKQKMSLALKLTIPIGLSGIILVSCIIIRRLKKVSKDQPSESLLRDPFMNISYGELVKATDGFSSAHLIGAGSFGSVYKGIFHPNETFIAVKVFNLQNRGASKSFMAECEALRSIRHRNLVKIITACSSVDFHGNDFKALVYEYMPNGSLETWLHRFAPVGNAQEQRSLNLLQRLNIAIDVGSALDYLHNQCQEPIIHCDVKPSNVLLDSDKNAHVGDFGLARFLHHHINENSHIQTSSVVLRGTIGYAAPEYGMGTDLSTQGDVYSYGILLLEMFTGKKPTDDMFNDGLNLHKFVDMALPGGATEIVDHVLTLLGEEEEEAARVNTCLISILRIGVACSKESPRERMDICDAVLELHSVRDMIVET